MAEKLFEEALTNAEIKKNITVFSAGISAMDGDQASENSIQACEEVGLDLKDHRSAALTRATAEMLGNILHDGILRIFLQMILIFRKYPDIFDA